MNAQQTKQIRTALDNANGKPTAATKPTANRARFSYAFLSGPGGKHQPMPGVACDYCLLRLQRRADDTRAILEVTPILPVECNCWDVTKKLDAFKHR